MTKLPSFCPASPLYSSLDTANDSDKAALRTQNLRPRTAETGGSFGKDHPTIGPPGRKLASSRSVTSQGESLRKVQEARHVSARLQAAPASPLGPEQCKDVSGKWIEKPWPEVTEAQYLGVFTDGVWLEHRIEVTVQITGELQCLDCGSERARIRASFGPYKMIVPYRILIITMFLPLRLKLLLYAAKARNLVKFVSENKELLGLILNHYDKMIAVITNSADLICKGAFDPPQLKDYLPKPQCPAGYVCA